VKCAAAGCDFFVWWHIFKQTFQQAIVVNKCIQLLSCSVRLNHRSWWPVFWGTSFWQTWDLKGHWLCTLYFNCILAVHYAYNICSAWANVTRHINLQWLWILLSCMHLCLSLFCFYPNHLLQPTRYLSTGWSQVPAFHKVSSHAGKCALLQKLWCKWLNWQCTNCGLSICDVASYKIACVLIYISPKLCVWKLEVKMWYPFLKNFLLCMCVCVCVCVCVCGIIVELWIIFYECLMFL
jgi:hypothetical protein